MKAPVKCNAKYVVQSTFPNVITTGNTLLKPSGAYTGAGQKISTDPFFINHCNLTELLLSACNQSCWQAIKRNFSKECISPPQWFSVKPPASIERYNTVYLPAEVAVALGGNGAHKKTHGAALYPGRTKSTSRQIQLLRQLADDDGIRPRVRL